MTAYPILYSFRRCPYAMRARLALAVSDRVCELREVVLADKPQEMLKVSPKGTVPVLIDTEGRVLDESIDIMLWALSQHDPEKWLKPELGSLESMLEAIAQFDLGFKYHLDRYKYPNRYGAYKLAGSAPHEGTDAQSHQSEASLYLERLNAQLSATKYLFGNRVTLADMAIAPFIRQFAHVDLDWFNQQQWQYLQAWLARFIESDLFSRIMQKYPKWESGNLGVLFPAP
ncbi:glutathione S-transferase [Merismopedia glauca]|uniref:Glutathione S-transferase n=1 Tax=Merismopedia glauca CCAP 1448/3 TaxID=1296344 RepID=A0A2T1C168_9CYAN|nr:glutathione S-transferase [Merismopedia glauca]PSB01873.1 glutathione S-transferase [Merismopedia glauca CCAP 1448/3]